MFFSFLIVLIMNSVTLVLDYIKGHVLCLYLLFNLLFDVNLNISSFVRYLNIYEFYEIKFDDQIIYKN